MATKFVFNPFTGTFDIINVSVVSWEDLKCDIPDYIQSRPVVLSSEGYLKTAELIVTTPGSCKIEDLSGETVYSGTPYFP